MTNPTAPSRPTRSWERLLSLAGPVYAGLLVVGAAAFPAPPGGDVAAASRPGWLAEHTGAVIAQGLLRAVAALAFVVLAVGAARAGATLLPVGSALPSLALTGGLISGSLMLAAQTVSEAAALFVRDGGGSDATRALGSLQTALLDVSSLPATLLFLAVGLTALSTGLVPRWLGVLTLVGVPVALVDAASYAGGPVESIALVGLVYFLLWSVLAGTALSRPRATGPRAG